MICRYCGKASAEGLKYCSNCGANLTDGAVTPTSYQQIGGYLTEEELYEQKMARKRKNRRINIICLIILGVLVTAVVCFVKYLSSDVYSIKHSEPSQYPYQEWGETLENSCDESKWESKKEDDVRRVVYTGKIIGSEKKVEMIFEISDDRKSYSLNNVKVDGKRIRNVKKFVDDLFTDGLSEY